MEYIFISHSKSDERIKKFFAGSIEKNMGLKPILMEEEDWTHQNAGVEITNKIVSNDCKCLIVLIGKWMLFPNSYNYSFTHNWVGYEIGVAACRGIPIIVFEEDYMDFKGIVDFPVPHLNHYFRYKQDPNNSRYIGEVLKRLSFNILYQNDIYPEPFKAKCTFDHCNAKYLYWNIRKWIIGERMPCPVCRGIFRPGVNEVLTRDKRSDKHFPAGVQ